MSVTEVVCTCSPGHLDCSGECQEATGCRIVSVFITDHFNHFSVRKTGVSQSPRACAPDLLDQVKLQLDCNNY